MTNILNSTPERSEKKKKHDKKRKKYSFFGIERQNGPIMARLRPDFVPRSAQIDNIDMV